MVLMWMCICYVWMPNHLNYLNETISWIWMELIHYFVLLCGKYSRLGCSPASAGLRDGDGGVPAGGYPVTGTPGMPNGAGLLGIVGTMTGDW